MPKEEANGRKLTTLEIRKMETDWLKSLKQTGKNMSYEYALKEIRDLKTRWDALCQRIDASKFSDEAFSELFSRYTEDHRHYHNLLHVSSCIRELDGIKDRLANGKGEGIQERDKVELAIWFHDVVYDPKANDNEEKSAELAEQLLKKLKMGDAYIKDVKQLIMSTKHEGPPKTVDEMHLQDIDLSILGKSEKEYDEYEENIRREYASVEEGQFKQARIAFLKRLLGKEVYSTNYGRRYKAQAIRNMQRAIERLSKPARI